MLRFQWELPWGLVRIDGASWSDIFRACCEAGGKGPGAKEVMQIVVSPCCLLFKRPSVCCSIFLTPCCRQRCVTCRGDLSGHLAFLEACISRIEAIGLDVEGDAIA
jgi:hypothetical protein